MENRQDSTQQEGRGGKRTRQEEGEKVKRCQNLTTVPRWGTM